MADTTFPALKKALKGTNLGYGINITETDIVNTDYAVVMDDNNQIKLVLISDLIGDADIIINDDITLTFGTSDNDNVALSWTGQELLFEDTRTIDVSDGYNRTIHVGNTITMVASRYAAISNYTTLAGSAGLEAFGGKFTMVQAATKTIDGYFGAVMAEVKNNAAGCSTASAIFLRWDNDNSSGFGETQSFIRIEDNSSSTKIKYFLDTLTVLSGDDSTAVLFRTGGNTSTNIYNTAGIHIKVNGAAYYIPCIPEGNWSND